MNVALRERAIGALASAPPAVQKAFIKQMNCPAQLNNTPRCTPRSTTKRRTSGKPASTTTGAFTSRSKMMPTSSTTSFRTPSEKGLIPANFNEPNGLLALDARERLEELVESVAGLYEVEKSLDGHTGSRKTRGAVHNLLINRQNVGQRRSLLRGHSFKVGDLRRQGK